MDMMELIRQEMPRLHLLEQLLPQQPLHPLFGPPTYDLFVAGLSCEDFPLFRWSLMTFHDATRVDYARTLSRHGFLVNATVKFPTKELAQAALHEFPFEAFGEAVYAARDPRCMQWTDEELVRELDCARLTYVLIDNIAPGFPRTLARQVRELGGVPFGFVDIDDDFIFTGLAAFPTPQAAHAAVREFDGHPFAGRAMVARAEGARALAEAARILHDEHVARRQQQHGAPWDPQREIERVRLQDPARTFNIRVRILREHGRTLMHWVHFFNGRVFRRVREPFTVYVSFASRAAADGAMAVLNAMRAHDGSRRFAAARDLQHGMFRLAAGMGLRRQEIHQRPQQYYNGAPSMFAGRPQRQRRLHEALRPEDGDDGNPWMRHRQQGHHHQQDQEHARHGLFAGRPPRQWLQPEALRPEDGDDGNPWMHRRQHLQEMFAQRPWHQQPLHEALQQDGDDGNPGMRRRQQGRHHQQDQEHARHGVFPLHEALRPEDRNDVQDAEAFAERPWHQRPLHEALRPEDGDDGNPWMRRRQQGRHHQQDHDQHQLHPDVLAALWLRAAQSAKRTDRDVSQLPTNTLQLQPATTSTTFATQRRRAPLPQQAIRACAGKGNPILPEPTPPTAKPRAWELPSLRLCRCG